MAGRPALVAGLRDARATHAVAVKFGLVETPEQIKLLADLEKAEAEAAAARKASAKPNTFYEKVIVGGYENRAARRAAKAGREKVSPAKSLISLRTAALVADGSPEAIGELTRRFANGSKFAEAGLLALAKKAETKAA